MFTRPVGLTIDVKGTHATNPFAAIVVKGHRVIPAGNELIVQHIEHFQERHILRDISHGIVYHGALIAGAFLAPDFEQ
jgi:hypothetical protein